jgi:cadmium resistance protein CadD (predicted permease)
MLRAAALAFVAFASTNIDDIFVLIGFFSNRALRRAPIVIGQYLGFIALTVASLACSLLAIAIPDPYIHFLAILPILIGVWHLAMAWRSSDEQKAATGAAFSVASVTIVNGTDNIAVYVPLFGRQPAQAILATCAVFAVMTGLWCGTALWLVNRPTLGAPIKRWGERLMPLVLIGLGVFIWTS